MAPLFILMLLNIIIFVILLLFSALFSGSETAFLSLGKVRLKQIEGMDTRASKRVVGLLSDPKKLLISILVGNTIVNIAASSVLADCFFKTIGVRGVGYSIVLMTILVLVFGEVTPKMFSLHNAKKVSFFSSGFFVAFEYVATPFRIVLTKISNFLVKMLGVRVVEDTGITEQEIRSLFSMSHKKGVVKSKEKDMIESILEFKELNAADVMTPRIDIVALDLSLGKEELTAAIKEGQCSRLPAFIHTLDNMVGVVHSKDFLLDPDTSIKDIVKKPYFVPESMKIDDLLQGLQKRHVHMAVVTDEYGVTSGLVTIEDILEEIVGEIRDEFDFESPKVKKVDRNTHEISGKAHIDEVNDELGIAIETNEVDTIGGYVTLKIGEMPQAGDKIDIEGYTFVVNDVSKNRITTLTVEKIK